MLLTWALTLFCCLRLITLPIAGACSSFPNHICCSSSSSSFEIRDQKYPSTIIEPIMAESSAMNDTLPKSLRILCFGDSLTAGYTSHGWEFYPYADHLRAGLQRLLSTSGIDVDVDGFSGDQVRGSYLPRIKRKCANTETPYDWIIVMGGTNDLGWGQSPETIYEGLRKLSCHSLVFTNTLSPHHPITPGTPHSPCLALLSISSLSSLSALEAISRVDRNITEKVWRVALDTGANVLALNILEAEASSDIANSRRNSLNDKIVNHQQER